MRNHSTLPLFVLFLLQFFAVAYGELCSTYGISKKVCCEISSEKANTSYYPNQFPQFPSEHKICFTRRHYHSSPYEQKHLQIIKEVSPITSKAERRQRYVEFMFEDLPDALKMLNRVQAKMAAFEDPPAEQADHDYLSRFHVKKTCVLSNHQEEVQEWTEWIEPITVHFRHPLATIGCASEFVRTGKKIRLGDREIILPNTTTPVGLTSRDYIIISNQKYALNSYSASKLSPSPAFQRKSYLFDFGSKDFFSSLYWFVCGYVQRGIDFDQIFAFEILKTDVDHYWDTVPGRIIPFLHFINKGVQSSGFGESSSHLQLSVERILQQIVHIDDFVSMKLDIDTPSIELPIFFNLLHTNITTAAHGAIPLAALIDEFFFELHFQCEFLEKCGWGRNIPDFVGELKLDRLHAAQNFLDLRRAGVRAHIWP